MQRTEESFQTCIEMLHVEYMTSFYGIIKFLQIILSLGCFIAASSNSVIDSTLIGAAGWVQFVSILSFVVSFIFYVLHCFRLEQKIPTYIYIIWIEFIFSLILTLFYIIGGIVSSIYIYYRNLFLAYMAATAFFTWACTLLYVSDAIALFVGWKNSSEGPNFSNTDAGAPA